MTQLINHEEARNTLGALALDTLDMSERAAVLSHVAGCVTCRGELALLERTASELAYAVTPVSLPADRRDRIRERLMARAVVEREASTTAVSSGPARNIGAVLPGRSAVPITSARSRLDGMSRSTLMALAASVVAVVSLGLLAVTLRERDSLRDALRTASALGGSSVTAVDSLRNALEDRDRLIANLTGPRVAVMTLASTSSLSPSGRMFWDQAHDAWTFVGHHLQAPAPGRTYQLWLVTRTAKISAGTFTPAGNGEAVVRATYALPQDELAAVAVTEEPATGSPQPTSAPFLVASSRRTR